MASEAHIHVGITAEFSARLNESIPDGLKSAVIRLLVEALVEHIEKNGRGILGPLLAKEFDVRGLIVQNLNIPDSSEKESSHAYTIRRPTERRSFRGTIGDRRAVSSSGVPGRSSGEVYSQPEESSGEGETKRPVSVVPKGEGR